MEQADIERTIGRLEEATGSLKEAVPSILTAIERSRLENKETASRHAEEDRIQFGRIHDSLGSLTERVRDLEGITPMVESHGDAIVTIETRLADVETKAAVAAGAANAARQVNARWSRGLIGSAAAVGAVAGTAGTAAGPKLWKALYEFLKAL